VFETLLGQKLCLDVPLERRSPWDLVGLLRRRPLGVIFKIWILPKVSEVAVWCWSHPSAHEPRTLGKSRVWVKHHVWERLWVVQLACLDPAPAIGLVSSAHYFSSCSLCSFLKLFGRFIPFRARTAVFQNFKYWVRGLDHLGRRPWFSSVLLPEPRTTWSIYFGRTIV